VRIKPSLEVVPTILATLWPTVVTVRRIVLVVCLSKFSRLTVRPRIYSFKSRSAFSHMVDQIIPTSRTTAQ